jgi:hypothetical protein
MKERKIAFRVIVTPQRRETKVLQKTAMAMPPLNPLLCSQHANAAKRGSLFLWARRRESFGPSFRRCHPIGCLYYIAPLVSVSTVFLSAVPCLAFRLKQMNLYDTTYSSSYYYLVFCCRETLAVVAGEQ